jgi:hypothetical protein
MVASQTNKSRLAACQFPEGRRQRIAGERPVWDDSVFRALARRWTHQGQHRWEMA